jgi:hypothetical protein
MSNMLGQTASRDQTRTLPQGETVGTYTAYLDAQKAVDYLADQQFAVQNVSILGNDLKTVERVTGRLSYPRVALAGAATGAWFGLFVGVVLMLFGGTEGYSTLLSSMALGAGFWMLFGVITYAMQRGKRDFTSTSQVVASNYQVIVSPEAAGEARRLLQQLPMNGRGGPSGPGYGQGQGPNQYGPNQNGPGYGAGGPTQGGTGQGQGSPGYGPGAPVGKAPERPAGWEDPYQEPNSGIPGQPQNPQGDQPQNQPYGQPTAGPQGHHPAPGGPGSQPADNGAGQSSAAAQAQPQEPQSPPLGQFPDLPDGRPQYGERLPAANPPASENPHAGQSVPSQPQQAPPEPSRPQGTSESRPQENDEPGTEDREAGSNHPADEDRDRK